MTEEKLTAAECNQGIEDAANAMLEAAAEGDAVKVNEIYEEAAQYANVRDRQRSLKRSHIKALEALEEAEQDEVGEVMELAPYDVAKLKINSAIVTIHLLMLRLFEQQAINLTPPYQRSSNLWSKTQMSQLIESILLRLPIPAFFVHEDENGRWDIVDGLQRCSALSRFLVGEMKLSGLEHLTRLNGKRFTELPIQMQRQINEYNLTFHVVEYGTPMAVVFNIFRRLNKGGLKLSAQEIRNALNQGPAIDTLRSMASDEDFQKATDNGVSARRQVDLEVCLRWFSFAYHGLDAPQEYKVSDMDGWLCDAMARLNKMNLEERSDWVDRWSVVCKAAHAIWGDAAWRKPLAEGGKRTSVSKALLGSLGWALNVARDGFDTDAEFLDAVDKSKEGINNAFVHAFNTDAEYLASISYSTRDVKVLRKRFAVASSAMDPIHHELEG